MLCYVMLCYVILCILSLKSIHKNSLLKTNKLINYWLIGATVTPGDQIWSPTAVAAAAATTYSDEV